MRAAARPSGVFQAVDQHGDGIGGEGQPGAEVALGEPAAGLQML